MTLDELYNDFTLDDITAAKPTIVLFFWRYIPFDLTQTEIKRIMQAAKNANDFLMIFHDFDWWRDVHNLAQSEMSNASRVRASEKRRKDAGNTYVRPTGFWIADGLSERARKMANIAVKDAVKKFNSEIEGSEK